MSKVRSIFEFDWGKIYGLKKVNHVTTNDRRSFFMRVIWWNKWTNCKPNELTFSCYILAP